jgi:predicted transport protein
VIDQGYAYLSLMLNNKADFILEFNETSKESLKRKDVDWSQSRVIFISPSFTTYQKEAINFKDLPIELWEIKRYNNSTVNYNQIISSGAQESIKTISRKDDVVEQVNKEVKVFTEHDHLEDANSDIKEMYYALKERIINLDDNVAPHPKKKTIGFKIENQIFCDFVVQSKALKIYLNLKSGDLEDAKNISRDVSNVGHWGNGSYEIKVQDLDDIEYLLSLIKQSIRINKGEY